MLSLLFLIVARKMLIDAAPAFILEQVERTPWFGTLADYRLDANSTLGSLVWIYFYATAFAPQITMPIGGKAPI